MYIVVYKPSLKLQFPTVHHGAEVGEGAGADILAAVLQPPAVCRVQCVHFTYCSVHPCSVQHPALYESTV